MKHVLWASIEKRGKKETLVLYRKEAVSTARGPVIQDITVISIEDPNHETRALDGEAVEVDIDVQYADPSGKILATFHKTDKTPYEPQIKRTNFDDPESERRKKARGMGRYMGKESKPSGAPGTPPVPPEQKRATRGKSSLRASRGRRRRK